MSIEDNIKLLQSKSTDEWGTPQDFYDKLNNEFRFTLDVCATKENHKHNNYYTKEDNALQLPWNGVIWCNPPYSKTKQFFEKAHKELKNGNCKTAVFLVNNNSDTRWFHDYVLGKAEIRYIKGRLKFEGKNTQGKKVKNPSMRPSIICVLRNTLYHGV